MPPILLVKRFGAAALLGLALALPAGAAENAADEHHDAPHAGMHAPVKEDSMSMHHHDGAAALSFGRPGRPEDVVRTIPIVLEDTRFTPDHVAVKQGETIRFVLRNAGAADHDFTLGDEAAQQSHRREMAAMAEAEGGHAHHHDHDDHGKPAEGGMPRHPDHPNAVMVAAGRTTSLIWTFDRPGEVGYACNVPGHFEAGMKGSVTVAP